MTLIALNCILTKISYLTNPKGLNLQENSLANKANKGLAAF